MSCLLSPDCPCEGPARPDWPMPDSPPSFFPTFIFRRREEPDRFVLESLQMAVMGVE